MNNGGASFDRFMRRVADHWIVTLGAFSLTALGVVLTLTQIGGGADSATSTTSTEQFVTSGAVAGSDQTGPTQPVVQTTSSLEAGPASTVTHVALGASLTYGSMRRGELLIADDYDDWQFEGVAGDVVTLEAVGSDGLDRMRIRVFDDRTDDQIAGPLCSDNIAHVLNLILPTTGSYTARVESCGRTGNYELTLDRP